MRTADDQPDLAPSSDLAARDRRVRRTRRALHRAVIELVLSKGYGAVTADDIADRADVTRATFYRHYANKDDLLSDVADQYVADVQATFAGLPAGQSRMVSMLRQSRSAPDVTSVILSGEGNGVALRRFTALVEEVLFGDIAAGRLPHGRPDVDLQLLATVRAAQVLAGMRWFLEHPTADPERVAADLRLLFDFGLIGA